MDKKDDVRKKSAKEKKLHPNMQNIARGFARKNIVHKKPLHPNILVSLLYYVKKSVKHLLRVALRILHYSIMI